MTQELLRKAFDQEIEKIRSNPKLCGDWGLLQDYLHNCLFESGCSNFNTVKLEDGRVVTVLYAVKDGSVTMTMALIRKDYIRVPGEKPKPEDIFQNVFEMPEDLQKIIKG